MSALEPGLYRATVRGVADVTVLIGHLVGYYLDGDLVSAIQTDEITDARPLTVIDISTWFPHRAAAVLKDLRGRLSLDTGSAAFLCDVLDQIEAQTKPARIEEPGLWGVVEATITQDRDALVPPTFRFVRIHTGPFHWMRTETTRCFDWADLIDPTLIREGLS